MMKFINRTFSRLLKNRRYYTPYYKRTLHRYTNTIVYYELYNRVVRANDFFSTKEKIAFSNQITFGSTFNQVKNRFYGSFRVVNKVKHITILFSEMKIDKYKFSLEMHFFKDSLVFFKYVFRNNEQKDFLLNMIREKYLNKSNKEIKNQLFIRDNHQNCIYIENEVDLSINYVSFNHGFFEYLSMKKEEEENFIFLKNTESTEKLYNVI